MSRDAALAALRRGRSFARRDMTSVVVNFTSPTRARERLGLSTPPTRLRAFPGGHEYHMLFATLRLHNVYTPAQLPPSRPRRILAVGGQVDAGGVIRTAVALGFEEIWLLAHTVAQVTVPQAAHSTAGALLRVGALVADASMDDFAARCRELGASVYTQQDGALPEPMRPPSDAPVALIVGHPNSPQQLAELNIQPLGLRVDQGSPSTMAAASIAMHQLATALARG